MIRVFRDAGGVGGLNGKEYLINDKTGEPEEFKTITDVLALFDVSCPDELENEGLFLENNDE